MLWYIFQEQLESVVRVVKENYSWKVFCTCANVTWHISGTSGECGERGGEEPEELHQGDASWVPKQGMGRLPKLIITEKLIYLFIIIFIYLYLYIFFIFYNHCEMRKDVYKRNWLCHFPTEFHCFCLYSYVFCNRRSLTKYYLTLKMLFALVQATVVKRAKTDL